tara:strand:+ start:2796 stop:3938 length:1143 start_codon:yes stop_codon:yes gene_type:complete
MLAFSAAIFCFWASLYVYVPTLAVFAQDRGADFGIIGLIVAAYGLVQFALRIPTGYLADRFGKRSLLIQIGLMGNLVGAVGMTIWNEPWLLVLWRCFHGVGAASFVVIVVYFSSFFPASQATRATSILMAGTTLSQVVISLAGGAIASKFGPEATFLVAALMAMLGMASMCIAGQGSIVESRPISLDRFRQVFTVRLLLISATLAAIGQFIVFGVMQSFFLIYASNIGASSLDLGIITTLGYLSAAFAATSAAVFVFRMGERNFVVAGSLASGAVLISIPLVETIVGVQIMAFLLGGARGMVFPVLMGIALNSVELDQRASATGVFQCIYAVGMFLGPAVGGVLAEFFGLSSLFGIMGAVAFVGAVGAMLLPKRSSTFGA